LKDDRVYLRHILDATEKVEEYTAVGHDLFMEQTHWQDAVIRQLEIIGEATKRISSDTRDRYPDVPWKRIAGLRDVLIHGYMGVDVKAVWEITRKNIPELKKNIISILGVQ